MGILSVGGREVKLANVGRHVCLGSSVCVVYDASAMVLLFVYLCC